MFLCILFNTINEIFHFCSELHTHEGLFAHDGKASLILVVIKSHVKLSQELPDLGAGLNIKDNTILLPLVFYFWNTELIMTDLLIVCTDVN